MNKKRILFFILCVISSALFSQSDNGNEFVFKVSHPKVTYSVWPADSEMWTERLNPVIVRQSGQRKPFKLRLTGGTIQKGGSDSLYFARVDSAPKVLLSVLERSKGQWKVVFSKIYHVKRIPDPIIYVCGVKTDSVIDKQQLIEEDMLTGYSTHYKKYVKINGFNMIFMNGESADTLTSTNSHFTLEMRRRIHVLTPGNMLFFDKVKCEMPDGKTRIPETIQVFIADTGKYKVGYRTTTK